MPHIMWAQIHFTAIQTLDLLRLGDVTFGDIDGDGDEDIIAFGYDNSLNFTTKLYENNAGIYTSIAHPFPNMAQGEASFADIDGDNDLDLLILGIFNTGFGASTAVLYANLYINDGNGNFTQDLTAPFLPATGGSARFNDIDNDGDSDVVVSGFSFTIGRYTKVYRNNAGVFSEISGTTITDMSFGDIQFGDVDNDGDDDLFVSGLTNAGQRTYLYMNDGAGGFTQNASVLPTIKDSKMQVVDMDNDGDLDLLITGELTTNGGLTAIYLNDSLGNFSLLTGTSFLQVREGDINAIDADSDGDLDFILSGKQNNAVAVTRLYRNDGNNNYNIVSNMPFVSLSDASSATADVDNDGDLDFVIMGRTTNNTITNITRVYYNTSNPLPPIGDCYQVQGAGISAANGDYFYNGDLSESGHPIYFMQGGNYRLRHTPDVWHITTIFSNATLYFNSAGGFLPGGTYGTSGFGGGVAPAPSVTPGCVPPLPTDDPCSALAMQPSSNNGGINSYGFFGSSPNCSSSSTLSNVGATATGTYEASCGGANGKSVWFTFTTPGCADVSGKLPFEIEVSTDNAGTTVDTKLEIFSSSNGTCSGTFTSLGCNDNASGTDLCSVGSGNASTITILSATLDPGTTYYVLVDEVGGDDNGNYELSIQANLLPPTLSFSSLTNRLEMNVPNSGAYLYSYYWRPMGYSGYSISNKSTNSHDANISTGTTYEAQVMHRCTPNQFYRTPVASISTPVIDACNNPVNDLICQANTATSVTIAWSEKTGMYTNNGVLSGYIIYYRQVGVAGYSYISNPSVSCVAGTCNYTISVPNGVPHEFWIRTRCTPDVTRISNIITCTAGGVMRPSNDEDIYSFSHNGVEYVDVKLHEDWNDFGQEIPDNGEGYLDFSSGTLKLLDTSPDLGNVSIDFTLYPNPASSAVTLHLSNNTAPLQYQIINVNGQTVSIGQVEANVNEKAISTSHLNKGIYFVSLFNHSINSTKKLIVQ